MAARVCLVTTGQPSTNPRLVKEADALTDAGYQVHVIAAHWTGWASETDPELMARRRWSLELIDWRRDRQPWLFWKTRIRHRMANAALAIPTVGPQLANPAIGRLTPELGAAARGRPADLYIAHNLGALPAAASAARLHRARLGFDAEDLHSGQFPRADASPLKAAVERTERRYVPLCDYVTAAAPGIAEFYQELRPGRRVAVVLNVFPLADRPAQRRSRLQPGPLRLYWFSQTIGPGRGLEHVLEALGRIAALPVELHLRGVWASGFEAEFRGRAASLGLGPNQIVWHSPAGPDEMVRLAGTFDVGLALEPGDTVNSDLALSNKVFTCLLAGVPVLATATTAQQALATQCAGAVVVTPPRDALAMAAAIRRWHDDRAELDRLSQVAWDLATSRFNWEAENAAFLKEVATVLESAAAGAVCA